jgi:cytochrome c oxidase cbb3-type subunit 2
MSAQQAGNDSQNSRRQVQVWLSRPFGIFATSWAMRSVHGPLWNLTFFVLPGPSKKLLPARCAAPKRKIASRCRALLVCIAASIASPSLAPAASGSAEAQVGQAVYEQHCVACHGLNGDGNGAASVWLFPRPRDFSAGLFKIKSTPDTALPTDNDLLTTLARGMPGSSMPSFTYLSERDRRDVVQYVKFLTSYTNASGQHINRFDEAKKNGDLADPIQVSSEPAVTLQALGEGNALFNKFGCIVCHGETGAGDGPNASSLKDTKGLFLPPRDFNNGAFRGGATGRDLFLRTLTGLPGTPMAPYATNLMTDSERWSLVHYIQSLRRKDVEINDILASADNNIHVQKVRKLPSDPVDPFWESMDPARIQVNPLWPEKI